MNPPPIPSSIVGAALCACLAAPLADDAAAPSNARPFRDDRDAEYWLHNMAASHRFTLGEIADATGLSPAQAQEAIQKRKILERLAPPFEKAADDPMLIQPYPGGRHPRIGFLDGAVDPQRETKFSVFLPWDQSSYVVVDLPEAIWSQWGLLYLAHTHIDTLWTKQNIAMERLEWERRAPNRLSSHRALPNGVSFGADALSTPTAVLMSLWLKNGTAETLRDLRVQNCVMLKGALDFNQQTGDNKIMRAPYVACRNTAGNRWIITAWRPNHRPWHNPPVPCLHSDPKFPDLAPGDRAELQGWLSFYQGEDVLAEFDRIDALSWWSRVPSAPKR